MPSLLILASGSAIRRKMLEDAGVVHQWSAPGVDERAVKDRLSDHQAIALELAKAKALAINSVSASDWVIGSDSMATVAGRAFDKPRCRDEAAEHLHFFSGKIMHLTSAVALARGATIDWSHVDVAELCVRTLSRQFIDIYLDAEWPDVAGCVGVFRLEGRGVHLFDQVHGSHFTILGMPLIPLLGALRERAVLPS